MWQKLIRFYRDKKHRYLIKIPNDYQGFILILILLAIWFK
jgi:hypothetical protein